jgi:hypothetical protein
MQRAGRSTPASAFAVPSAGRDRGPVARSDHRYVARIYAKASTSPADTLTSGNDRYPETVRRTAHKLQAALKHAAPDSDDDLGENYRIACAAWFAALSDDDKTIAELAAQAFADGHQTRVLLPRAPVSPLL